MRTIRTVLVVTVAAGLTSCQSSLPGGTGFRAPPPLTAEAAAVAGLTTEQVSNANTLYVTKCAKCHNFYHPADYSAQGWDVWMRKMSRKARLKPSQEALLRQYLGAFREQARGAAPERNLPVKSPVLR